MLESGHPLWWVNEHHNKAIQNLELAYDHPQNPHFLQRSLQAVQDILDGQKGYEDPSLQGEAEFFDRIQRLLESSANTGNIQVARHRLRALRNHFDADVILKCELDKRSQRGQSSDEEDRLADAVFQEMGTSADRAYLLESAQYFERRAVELSS
jgi:hypothetical protein